MLNTIQILSGFLLISEIYLLNDSKIVELCYQYKYNYKSLNKSKQCIALCILKSAHLVQYPQYTTNPVKIL